MRSVEATPAGARLTITVEGQTGGFFWLLPDRFVAVPARRRLKAMLDNVKSFLEARS